MKNSNPLYKLFGLFLVVLTVVACQEDFSPVGSDIIADPNFEFDLYDQATVVAYSRRAFPVQTNNLPAYQLGVYNDPVYGITEASILSQVTMDQTNPSFGENPEIKEVILSIPFFATAQGTGNSATFSLDSVFGNSPFKLSVYESNFFLRDLDPNTGFDEPQKYYSNQGPLFQNFLGQLLFETNTEIGHFLPSSYLNVVINEGEENEERLSPRLRVKLDEEAIAFFTDKIIDKQGTDALLNNTNFKNHFRGVYFIAEALTEQGNLSILDIRNSSIEIIYERDDDGGGGAGGRSAKALIEEERVEASFRLSFNGINVNTFKNSLPSELENILNNPNTAGADNLYLKGGAGTITIIELFGNDSNGNNIADELEDLRSKKWIINEANLTFKVNKNLVNGGSTEPERIFLYDLNNRRVLLDYQLDNNTPASDILNFKTSHLGRLKRDASSNGESYKLRITNHISNLINRDSTNVRLGLVVSQNVNVVSSQSLQNSIPPGVKTIPTTSVLSPQGTVLYGSNPSNPENRVKLNIFYTEINN
jgi:hypothetical protein